MRTFRPRTKREYRPGRKVMFERLMESGYSFGHLAGMTNQQLWNLLKRFRTDAVAVRGKLAPEKHATRLWR